MQLVMHVAVSLVHGTDALLYCEFYYILEIYSNRSYNFTGCSKTNADFLNNTFADGPTNRIISKEFFSWTSNFFHLSGTFRKPHKTSSLR